MRRHGLRSPLAGVCVAVVLWSGCAHAPLPLDAPAISVRVQALLPADALLLGEQHDNPDHQRIQHSVVDALIAQDRLAAVVIEMSPRPQATTALARMASEAEVRAALQWDEKAWPWGRYAPALMAAVRAGVPVLGANLPRAQMREAMGKAVLDARLDAAALALQQQAIREGHCGLLPESQIAPMTRIQIARDIEMAGVLAQAAQRAQGKTVLLVAGSGHVDRALGIARHLPSGLEARFVRLASATPTADSPVPGRFDALWPTLATPQKDYCAGFKASRIN